MLRKATWLVILSTGAFVTLASPGFAQTSGTSILSLQQPPGPSTFASPEGRVLIGRGKDYRPIGGDKDPQVLFDELMKNMKQRRDFAWKIVDQLLQPTRIALPDGAQVDVPLWQTWYDGTTGSATGAEIDEITPLFKTFFEKLKANPSANLSALADEVLGAQPQKDLSRSVTSARFTTRLRQNDPAVATALGQLNPALLQNATTLPTALGGQGTTMFSPAFVKHMMVSAKEVERCTHVGIKTDTPPPSPNNFSHCFKEFPREAVMVKTSWIDLSDGLAVHNTAPDGMTAVINEGTWPAGTHPSRPPTVVPTNDQLYVNQTADGRRFGLAGLHLVTKDVREWVWVSLWWNPNAANDFGADKPASIANYNGGVWKNYKMCVASAFDEGDPQPWSHYSGDQATLGQSIKATYDAIQAHVDRGVVGEIIMGVPNSSFPPSARGPWAVPHNKNTAWCSNPFVESHTGNGRTSCIGCHQIVLTESLINPAGPANFFESMFGFDPQFGRSRNFKNFTTDFSWAFQFQFQPTIQTTRQEVGFSWPN